MAQVINTNLPSLRAQHHLSKTQNGLSTTTERLSTGLRINSAKDDAAGLAISERMTSQIRGANQAVRNANDAVSYTQTAESSMGTLIGSLQRMRELAVQSANGSNTADDRKALNEEVKALAAEVKRISFDTEFNGMAILDGSQGNVFYQVGANQGQMIGVGKVDVRQQTLGSEEVWPSADSSPVANPDATRLTQDQMENLTSVGPITIELGSSPAPLNAGPDITTAPNSSPSLEDAVSDLNKKIQELANSGTAQGNAVSERGLKAFLRTDDQGRTGIVVSSKYDPDQTASPLFTVTGGTYTPVGTPNPVAAFAPGSVGTDTLTIQDINVLTLEGSSKAIGIIDGALDRVSMLRSEMGATQNRIESAISNMSTVSITQSAARSRIQDADYAAETAELTRLQILQQAGVSMLSQANAAPQQSLSLLQQ